MGFMSTVIIGTFTIGNAITVASIAFQLIQAKKARKAAKQAAEARKGFELVVEGDVSTLPIVYGRALVGGTRVYHNTSANFRYATPNSDKHFVTGPPGKPAGSYTYTEYDPVLQDVVTKTQNYPATEDGFLSRDHTGDKNEFLFFQQAVCQGPIQAVHDVIINESQYIDDPTLGTGEQTRMGDNVRAALRIDCHYAGGVADSIMTANFGERSNSVFSETAYASVAIRLDRDEPQFNGVPQLQFLVEGALVRKVVNGALDPTRVYSNNPAWCLLDYLLNTRSGKALPLDQVDLASFEAAAAVCDRIVQQDVYVGGKIYKPTDGSRNITTRDLPLYECNLIVDVAKPIRENIESILSSMGDARLVWSSGKYKLLLQYPENNSMIDVAGVITDDDLVAGSNIEINWPTSAERLNSCTVRFHNEAENFKEDSVSFPPKSAGTYLKGIGGKKYAPQTGWDGKSPNGAFLNNNAVWDGNAETTSLSWIVVPKTTGDHVLRYAGDDQFTISVQGSFTASHSDSNVHEHTLSLVKDTQYIISMQGTNLQGLRGLAATLTSPDNNLTWTSRSDSYAAYVTVSVSNALYLAYKAEDSGIELETDVFAEPVTDYYHALAKAEELVRTSRSAFGVKLAFMIKDRYLEPGDIIRLESKTLKIGLSSDLFIRVNEIKVSEGGQCEITGTRFDWSQLAWNVKDDENVKPGSAYEFTIPAPQWLRYEKATNSVSGSAGTLTWAEVQDSRKIGYVLFAHVAANMDASGQPIFSEIGRATADATSFALPNFVDTSMIFGIRTLSSTGSMSAMTTTNPGNAVEVRGPTPPAATDLEAVVTGDQSDSVRLTWTLPATRTDGSAYIDHFTTNIYRSKINNPSTAVKVGQTEGLSFVERPTEFGKLYYWVKLVSRRAVEGAASNVDDVTVNSATGGTDLTPPPTPTGFTVTALFSNFQLRWDQPTYTTGGGHRETLIYATPYPAGAPAPAFSESFLVSNSPGTIHTHPSALGTRMRFWIKWKTLGGGVSEVPAGPLDGQTGLVGNADLGPLIVEADNIAENGIDLDKFVPGVEPIKIVTTLPTAKATEVVLYNGKIYRWNTATNQYTASVATVDLSGTITNTQIADNAITTPKITAGAVTAGTIAANAVTAGKIAADAVTAGTIAAGAVVADKIAANAITAGKISAGAIAVGSAAIANGAIRNALIENAAIDSAKIADAAITTAKIGDLQVDTIKIAGNAVTIPLGSTGAFTASVSTTVYEPTNFIVIGTFTQGNGRNQQPWYMLVDGVVYVTETPDAGTLGAMSRVFTVQPGTHSFAISTSYLAGDAACGITVLGTKR